METALMILLSAWQVPCIQVRLICLSSLSWSVFSQISNPVPSMWVMLTLLASYLMWRSCLRHTKKQKTCLHSSGESGIKAIVQYSSVLLWKFPQFTQPPSQHSDFCILVDTEYQSGYLIPCRRQWAETLAEVWDDTLVFWSDFERSKGWLGGIK